MLTHSTPRPYKLPAKPPLLGDENSVSHLTPVCLHLAPGQGSNILFASVKERSLWKSTAGWLRHNTQLYSSLRYRFRVSHKLSGQALAPWSPESCHSHFLKFNCISYTHYIFTSYLPFFFEFPCHFWFFQISKYKDLLSTEKYLCHKREILLRALW